MAPTAADASRQLDAALRAWYAKEKERAKKEAKTLGPKGGIWDHMPEIDSKAAMRTTTVFESVLGIGLDETLVTSGGYPSIDAMIRALVPAMVAKAKLEGRVE